MYVATLLKVLISCRDFQGEFLGSLIHTIISFGNKDILTSSFPICKPLVSFSCLIALAKTSGTILTRSDESGQPCHSPDF